jgi:DNA-directed RNA polymerase subunit RPC12/RpoP
MKYICASCKTIYNESELNIDPMSSIQTCPKCGRVGSRVYSKEELASKINYYKKLYESLSS